MFPMHITVNELSQWSDGVFIRVETPKGTRTFTDNDVALMDNHVRDRLMQEIEYLVTLPQVGYTWYQDNPRKVVRKGDKQTQKQNDFSIH
jgi:hypothetical protein